MSLQTPRQGLWTLCMHLQSTHQSPRTWQPSLESKRTRPTYHQCLQMLQTHLWTVPRLGLLSGTPPAPFGAVQAFPGLSIGFGR